MTQKRGKEQPFIMLPSMDFCFQELMEEESVRKGFVGAILGTKPESIQKVDLLPKS